jgi:WD40 repeat protein
VLHLDLRHSLDATAVCCSYAVSQEEVNSIAVSAANGGWLAAADDAGEAHVMSLQPQQGMAQPSSHAQGGAAAAAEGQTAVEAAAAAAAPVRVPATCKTLRRGHSNICSSVAFRPHRPWELLSGGLDATVVMWDFSRLRSLQTWNLNTEATASRGERSWGGWSSSSWYQAAGCRTEPTI